jgi:hypothetical protein
MKLVRICAHKQFADIHRTRLRACQCPHQLRCYRQLQLPPKRRPLPLWRGDMRRPGVAMCCHPWISMMIPPDCRISHVFPCCWQWGMRNGSDVNVPWPDWNEDGTLRRFWWLYIQAFLEPKATATAAEILNEDVLSSSEFYGIHFMVPCTQFVEVTCWWHVR